MIIRFIIKKIRNNILLGAMNFQTLKKNKKNSHNRYNITVISRKIQIQCKKNKIKKKGKFKMRIAPQSL
jgi:hypothetical protein